MLIDSTKETSSTQAVRFYTTTNPNEVEVVFVGSAATRGRTETMSKEQARRHFSGWTDLEDLQRWLNS